MRTEVAPGDRGLHRPDPSGLDRSIVLLPRVGRQLILLPYAHLVSNTSLTTATPILLDSKWPAPSGNQPRRGSFPFSGIDMETLQCTS